MRQKLFVFGVFVWFWAFGGLGLAQDAKTKPDASGQGSQAGDKKPADGAKAAPAASSQKPGADSGGQGPAAEPKPATEPRSAAEENPFPEAESEKAAKEAKDGAGAAGAGAAGTGSSSADGLSGADSGDVANSARKKLRLTAPGGGPGVYDPKTAAEDVRVGKFYLKAGNGKAAYDRFKEASALNPEDAEAVFWLGEAARKLGLRDEAAANYRVYLEAVPEGGESKAARKALGELGLGKTR